MKSRRTATLTSISARSASRVRKRSVQRTLDAFASELPGFDARQSLYHLAYLAAPAPIVEWIGERTLGARMALGNAGRNDPAAWSRGKPVDCLTFGPPDAQSRARERIARFVRDEDGWLVLVLHGLDGEGWGTVASTALEQMLDEVLSANVAVTTPNRFLLSLAKNLDLHAFEKLAFRAEMPTVAAS